MRFFVICLMVAMAGDGGLVRLDDDRVERMTGSSILAFGKFDQQILLETAEDKKAMGPIGGNAGGQGGPVVIMPTAENNASALTPIDQWHTAVFHACQLPTQRPSLELRAPLKIHICEHPLCGLPAYPTSFQLMEL